MLFSKKIYFCSVKPSKIVKLKKYKMKRPLFYLLMIAAVTLSSCDTLNNLAGSDIAKAISTNLT